MNPVLIRKVRDKLNFARTPVTSMATKLRYSRRWISKQLRRSDLARKSLNLPSSGHVDAFDSTSGESGIAWTELYPGGENRCEVPTLHDERNRWWFDEHSLTERDPVGVATIEEGSVLGHYGGQYFDGQRRYIWNLGREQWRFFECFFVDSVLRLPKIERLAGTAAVLSDPFCYDNFSHWVFDILPRVSLLEQTVGLDSIDFFLIGFAGRGYQRDTLRQLGISDDRIKILDTKSHVSADRLVVPRPYGYNYIHKPKWRLDYLQEKFGSAGRVSPNRRLFISRKDASFRKLLQEDELYARLEPLGFESLTLAGLGLSETVDLFRSAEAVVGPFGSGLMNIAFSAPGTSVVEICTPKFYNAFHWYLSCERKLDHHVFFGDNGLIRQGHVNELTKDISIDVDACAEFVRTAVDKRGGGLSSAI